MQFLNDTKAVVERGRPRIFEPKLIASHGERLTVKTGYHKIDRCQLDYMRLVDLRNVLWNQVEYSTGQYIST